MIVDCVSDLHGNFPELEGGDLLIVAGDLTARDTRAEYIKFACWAANQKYKHKIFVGGNHDNHLVKFGHSEFAGCDYLCDSGTEFQGLKIWGSPWTKTFTGMNPKCKAFTCDTEEDLSKKWALIPENTNILITHSPPHGIMDRVIKNGKIENVGSTSLVFTKKVHLSMLKLWVFGHVHEGYGIKTLGEFFIPTYVNASHVNERYEPVNKPIRIVL